MTKIISFCLIICSLFSCLPLKDFPADDFMVTGTMKSVVYGADGYTAKLSTILNEIYFVTISKQNLGSNHEAYQDYETNKEITVVGELWQLGNELHVTVRDIPN